MTPPTAGSQPPLAPELEAVVDTAGQLLEADAYNPVALDERREAAQTAVIAAVQAGHPLAIIADAEADGRDRTLARMKPNLLKQVARTGSRVRQATGDYEGAIRRAGRAGISAREIATATPEPHAAPGTIRAILARTTILPEDDEFLEVDLEEVARNLLEHDERAGNDARDRHDGEGTQEA